MSIKMYTWFTGAEGTEIILQIIRTVFQDARVLEFIYISL